MKAGKKFTVFFVIMIIVSIIITSVGCSKAPSTDGQGNTEKSSDAAQTGQEKNYTISWIGGASSTTIEQNNWVQQQLEAKFPNVKFVNKKGDYTGTAQGAQNTQLMLAAKELPDAGYFYYDGNKLYDELFSRSISYNMLKQYTPSYAKMLDEYPVGKKMNLVEGKTDEYKYLQGFAPFYVETQIWANGFRLDWLEKVGITPNGTVNKAIPDSEVYWTDKPFTETQFMDILDKFTYGDPDGNKKDDTYGMGGCTDKIWVWNSIMGWFGITHGFNVEDNGTTQQWYSSSQYKDFLKFANEIYKKGYLDPEFPTLNWNKMQEKLSANKIGAFETMWLYLNPLYKDRAPAIITDSNPDAKVLFTPLNAGNNGKSGSQAYSLLPWSAGYVFFINAKVDDDKMAMILKILEYTAFDDEGSFMCLFGKEGLHFTWSGEPKKSTPIFTEETTTNKGKTGVLFYNANFISPIKNTKYFLTDFIVSTALPYMSGEWAKTLMYPHRYDPFRQTNLSEIEKEIGATISRIVDDFYYNAITGEIDVDSKWNDYIKDLNKAGYDRYLIELNKAPLYTDIISGK